MQRVKRWHVTALSRPWQTIRFLRGESAALQDAFVLAAAKHLFGRACRRADWIAALEELDRDDLVPQQKRASVGTSPDSTLGRWLYALIRATTPDLVVETGVSHGTSSWLILNALEKNGRGNLYSIDLPDRDTSAPYNVGGSSETGSAVPDVLRDRWRLILGDSSHELPHLLGTLSQIDVFFHDSDHSYAGMRREFDLALPRLGRDGVLVSDDVQKNAAFSESCSAHRCKAYVFRKGGTARRMGG